MTKTVLMKSYPASSCLPYLGGVGWVSATEGGASEEWVRRSTASSVIWDKIQTRRVLDFGRKPKSMFDKHYKE